MQNKASESPASLAERQEKSAEVLARASGILDKVSDLPDKGSEVPDEGAGMPARSFALRKLEVEFTRRCPPWRMPHRRVKNGRPRPVPRRQGQANEVSRAGRLAELNPGKAPT
jgi:hypothetical protein